MDNLPSRRRQMSALLFSLVMLLFCLPFQSTDETDYDFAVTNGINPCNMSFGTARYACNTDDGNPLPNLPALMSLTALFAGMTRIVAIDRTHLLSSIPLLLKRLLLAALKYRSNYMDDVPVRYL
ncbi:hypothetical protein [Paenibacillus dauci]|uniref:hypothetical protein n=1 Tax=Paenibacillus dauci TaxID=1567106 RepID=UPI0012E035E6|nr:hypothetical protein [Paenibacillus dauci]